MTHTADAGAKGLRQSTVTLTGVALRRGARTRRMTAPACRSQNLRQGQTTGSILGGMVRTRVVSRGLSFEGRGELRQNSQRHVRCKGT